MAEQPTPNPQEDPNKEDEHLKAIFAWYREQFPAGDPEEQAENQELIPIEQIIAEMEAIHREETGEKDIG